MCIRDSCWIGHSRAADGGSARKRSGRARLDAPTPGDLSAAVAKAGGGGGPNVVLILAVVAAVAFGYYKTQIASSDAE